MRIGEFKIKRKEVTNRYIKHYTTKVITIDDDKNIVGLDGFSSTDYNYISEFANKHNLPIEIWSRRPRKSNSIILVKYKGDYLLPRMSRDVMWEYDDVEFYMKPLLRKLGINTQFFTTRNYRHV